jgi:hypothetical protein
MKRLLTTLCVMFLATTAFAFNSTRRAERIGVLSGTNYGGTTMVRALVDNLRSRGFDAFDAEQTYEELLDREAVPIADYVVEIRGGEARTEDYGGIGIGGPHADVELGVLVSKVAAELRVYDGGSMKLIASTDLSKRTTAVMPTSVAIGGGAIYAYLALPLIERAQHRNVARKAAREAAAFVVATVRGE